MDVIGAESSQENVDKRNLESRKGPLPIRAVLGQWKNIPVHTITCEILAHFDNGPGWQFVRSPRPAFLHALRRESPEWTHDALSLVAAPQQQQPTSFIVAIRAAVSLLLARDALFSGWHFRPGHFARSRRLR
jgi:hypothetical protein